MCDPCNEAITDTVYTTTWILLVVFDYFVVFL